MQSSKLIEALTNLQILQQKTFLQSNDNHNSKEPFSIRITNQEVWLLVMFPALIKMMLERGSVKYFILFSINHEHDT